MGFSWALHFVQSGATEMVERSVGKAIVAQRLLDGEPAPPLTPERNATVTYVHKLQVVGLDEARVNDHYGRISRSVTREGVPLHEEFPASSHTHTLGYAVVGSPPTMHNSRKRLRRFVGGVRHV